MTNYATINELIGYLRDVQLIETILHPAARGKTKHYR